MGEHEHLIRYGIQGEADMDKREHFWGPTPITGYLLLWMCQRTPPATLDQKISESPGYNMIIMFQNDISHGRMKHNIMGDDPPFQMPVNSEKWTSKAFCFDIMIHNHNTHNNNSHK